MYLSNSCSGAKSRKDDINSNARFAMWEDLQSRFYDGKELMGSG